MPGQEAREQVRRLVDDAALAGLHEVRVVHGRGTGALRKAVRDELARHPLVERHEPDADDGATVASLGWARARSRAARRAPASRTAPRTIAPPVNVAALGPSERKSPHPERPEHDLEERDQRDLAGRDQARADRQEDEAEADLRDAERGEQRRCRARRPGSGCANGTASTKTATCERHIAGAIETSRR